MPADHFISQKVHIIRHEPEGLKKKLAAIRERWARIYAEIDQLEAQLDAQERTGQKGGDSYMLQTMR